MGKFETEFERLNTAQRHAVATIQGPLLVIAGPGTGKTQLLSMRVANILKKTDANPENILCLTFTEAAARNMRERLANLTGEVAYHVGIYTFHSFGSDVIQRYPEYFLRQPLLKPLDELGAYEVLLDIFEHLPHSNPLRLMLGGEFLHLHSVQTAISWLKQAGLEPDDLQKIVDGNAAFISYAEPYIEKTFTTTPSAKQLPMYERLLEDLRGFTPREADTSLADLITTELSEAIQATDANGRYAKPITEWRNKWLVQSHLKVWVMADRRRNRFLEAFISLYKKYQKSLSEKGWYTFDDMILRTIRALEESEELRLTLQEQYQYILVDEYQDTNGAQNKLLELLADSPVNEGRPNLMVVGDDDQAIYRFQGAHMSIMLDFAKRWNDVEEVVLTENYRSGKQLLDVSRSIIIQGQDRLETVLPRLSKELISGLATQPKTSVVRPQTQSELDQYVYIAKEVKSLITAGLKPKDIAILAPKHSFLKALVPYMTELDIPISYERREHILEQPRIVELLDLARLVQSAAEGDWHTVDTLIPGVLSAEYWNVPPITLWQLSVEAYRSKKLWLEIMMQSDNRDIRNFATALTVMAKNAAHEPLDFMLDQIIGNQAIELDDTEQWYVPYKRHYFNEQQLQKSSNSYFTLLGQLTTLRGRLHEYHPNQQLSLKDLMQFVEIYRSSNLTLLDTNPHATATDAVELMTPYKAKGLEWDTVFVLGCHNDIWGTKARNSKHSFALPGNLQWVRPARDSNDDRLRLFYVALTRAKTRLYLTCFKQTLQGKQTEPVSWLAGENPSTPQITEINRLPTSELVRAQEIHWGMTKTEQSNLRASLQPFLDNYAISATHINSFLDLTKGGPKHFFFTHMLHFPERLQPSSVFGSAVHQALHYTHVEFSKNQKMPALKKVQLIFEQNLAGSPLRRDDILRLTERGYLALEHFYASCSSSIKQDDKSEYNFSSEGVKLGDSRLTGKIDVLRNLGDKRLSIIDYKTGNPLTNFRPQGAYAQIRAHLYQHQLAFYKLLVEGSAHFKNFEVAQGLLQFVEPNEDGELINLEYLPDKHASERYKALVSVIWKHIIKLDFPDTSAYSLDLKGVIQFEEDLLEGKI